MLGGFSATSQCGSPLTRLITHHAERQSYEQTHLLRIKCSVACFSFPFCLKGECRESRKTTPAPLSDGMMPRVEDRQCKLSRITHCFCLSKWKHQPSPSQRCPSYEHFCKGRKCLLCFALASCLPLGLGDTGRISESGILLV